MSVTTATFSVALAADRRSVRLGWGADVLEYALPACLGEVLDQLQVELDDCGPQPEPVLRQCVALLDELEPLAVGDDWADRKLRWLRRLAEAQLLPKPAASFEWRVGREGVEVRIQDWDAGRQYLPLREVTVHDRPLWHPTVELTVRGQSGLRDDLFEEDPREHDDAGRENLRSLLRHLGYRRSACWAWRA